MITAAFLEAESDAPDKFIRNINAFFGTILLSNAAVAAYHSTLFHINQMQGSSANIDRLTNSKLRFFC